MNPTGVASAGTPGAAPVVFHDRLVRAASDVSLAPTNQALNYGTGVFEGIRAYWDEKAGVGRVFRMADHYRRMVSSAAHLRIDLGHDVEQLCAVTLELLRRGGHRGNVYVRPLGYKQSLEPGTRFGVRLRGVSSNLTITTVPMGSYTPADGLRVRISRWRRTPAACLPAHAKITGGYAVNALAVEEAHAAGDDDAILLGVGGDVAEASTANVFVVLADGTVATPPTTADILPGITRATVLDLLADELGASVRERAVTPADVRGAAEVFLTGTGVEIAPVIAVDGAPVGTGRAGQLTREIRRLYQDATHGRLPRRANWIDTYTPSEQAGRTTQAEAPLPDDRRGCRTVTERL